MEWFILFGRVYCFKTKKGDMAYKVDYLDIQTGRSGSDFIHQAEYERFLEQDIKPTTECIGHVGVNDYGRAYLSSVDIV